MSQYPQVIVYEDKSQVGQQDPSYVDYLALMAIIAGTGGIFYIAGNIIEGLFNGKR